jgi:hypothetical protein
MKKLLTILLLFVSINAQDALIITIGGSQAYGKFIEVTEKHVVFQQSGIPVPSKIPKMSVARVVLSNGDVVYMLTDEMTNEFKEKRKKILEEERKNSLTIEENQKLSGSGKCIIGCIMAVVVSYVLIDNAKFQ